MKKRLIAILLCLMLAVSCLPCSVLAQEEEEAEEAEEREEDSDEAEEGDFREESDEGEDTQEYGEAEYDTEEPSLEQEAEYEESAEEIQEIETGIEEELSEDAEEITDIEEDISEELIEEEYEETDILDAYALQEEIIPPSMADDSWQGYPLSYHYNWDNSANCWYNGMWFEGKCYKSPEGSYNTDVRHAVGLYCDGQNIHLYIKFATVYDAKVSGDDYNFSVDGRNASFRLVFDDDQSSITGCRRGEGVYKLDLKNGNGSMSGSSTGFVGTLTVHENNKNDELELIIPLTLLKEQNPSIDIEHFSTITFINHNLMHKDQRCAGAGNGKMPFILGSAVIFAAAAFGRRRFGEADNGTAAVYD